jgi:tripartite-type tricarboxylate transporter receptor subunit TctC
VDLVGIMYKGSGPAVTDLLGNQVPLGVDSIAATLPHIKAGKLKPIAMTGTQRAPQMPNVPTIAELGYKGFAGEGWGGIVVPKGTPPAIVTKIATDVRKVMSDPALQAKFVERGLVPDQTPQNEWIEFAKAELIKWGDVVKRANVKID